VCLEYRQPAALRYTRGEMESFVQIQSSVAAAGVADEKERLLFASLVELPSLIVALSGGIDSAYLAWAAHHVLGDRAVSITAISASYSAFDREQVETLLRTTGLRHEFIETHELENPAYRANNSDRCYFCKDELFSALDVMASNRQIAAVAYGVNADDTHDFRPGQRAARDLQPNPVRDHDRRRRPAGEQRSNGHLAVGQLFAGGGADPEGAK